MSDDVVRRYNGARPIQAPAQLLADAIHEIEVLREENARLRAVIQFILDNQISERRSEHIDCVIIHGEPIRAAKAAIQKELK